MPQSTIILDRFIELKKKNYIIREAGDDVAGENADTVFMSWT